MTLSLSDSRFFRERCFIGGEWINGDTRINVANPATGTANSASSRRPFAHSLRAFAS